MIERMGWGDMTFSEEEEEEEKEEMLAPKDTILKS